MNKLRWLVYVQIAFFAAWAAYCATNFSGAPAVWLDTTPVDPRDYISGQYVRLNYPLNNIGHLRCPRVGSAVYVKLEPSAKETPTTSGPVRLYEATACSAAPDGSGLWVKARLARGGNLRAEYGIERFYLNENSPLLNSRSGRLAAKAAIGRDRSMRLLELAAKTGGN